MENNIVSVLRAARNQEHKVPALVAESLKTRIGEIEESFRDPTAKYGNSQLIGAYGDIERVVFRKGPAVYEGRVRKDTNGKMVVENVKVCDYVVDVESISEEVFLTAKAAVNALLDGNLEEAAEPISAVARAVKMDSPATRSLRLDVVRRAVSNTPWYDENATESVDMPGLEYDTEDQHEGLSIALGEMNQFLEEALGEATTALSGIADQEFEPSATRLTQDVLRDTNRLLKLIEWADRTDAQEMAKVLAVVIGRAPSVARGLKQVSALAAANV